MSEPTTFCGIRYVSLEGPVERTGLVNVGILGVPTDLGSQGGSGQARAPYAVRMLEAPTSFYDPRTGIDYSEVTNVADFGDTFVVHGAIQETHEQVRFYVRDALGACDQLIIIGGDHSISAPAVAVADCKTLLHVDAHSDTGNYEESTGYHDHASWVRPVIEAGWVDNVYQFGIRAWGPSFRERVHSEKLRIIPGDFWQQFSAAMEILGVQADNSVYLSVDLDVVDPAFAPGVIYPEPGGWTSAELLTFITACMNTGKVRCLDLVETVPNLDIRDATLRLLHRSVLAAIKGVALHTQGLNPNGERTGESVVLDSGSR